MGAVWPLRTQSFVVFAASSLAAAVVRRGLGGPVVRAFARAPLPPGALVPSPFDANLRDRAAVQAALRSLGEQVGPVRDPVVILPDGTARLALLEVPPRTESVGFARYRLLPSLPYPANDAVVDVLDLPGGRVVGAAIRRSIVEEYETVGASVGLVPERVDLAVLAALAASSTAGIGDALEVILGEAEAALAAWRDGRLVALRTRLRDRSAGEAGRLADDLARTAALAGLPADVPVRAAGTDAQALLAALAHGGRRVMPPWSGEAEGLPVPPIELAWWGAAVS